MSAESNRDGVSRASFPMIIGDDGWPIIITGIQKKEKNSFHSMMFRHFFGTEKNFVTMMNCH